MLGPLHSNVDLYLTSLFTFEINDLASILYCSVRYPGCGRILHYLAAPPPPPSGFHMVLAASDTVAALSFPGGS